MKTKFRIILKVFLILFLLGNASHTQAQFLKNLKKRAEEAAKRTIERKVEKKTAEKTGEVVDDILEGDKKSNKKRRKKRTKKTPSTHQDDETVVTNKQEKEKEKIKIHYKGDFEPGNKVLYYDTFSNDFVNDFPISWNTNSSGAIVKFNDDDTKWLRLGGKGQFTPDKITNIPQNATFEFDLYVDKNYSFYSAPLYINIVEVKDKRKDFTKWKVDRHGANGVRIGLHPTAANLKQGKTYIQSYIDNTSVLKNNKLIDAFTRKNNPVHIGIWRQKKRIRVYINGKKVWDLPRAFGSANYNAVVFSVGEPYQSAETYFYVSNLRLAVAGKDKRHELIEKGHFTTNAIRFDVNKATIKPESYPVLDDIAKALVENPGVKIKIIGHTDSDGSSEANRKLSLQRAESVKNYLMYKFNIDANRLLTEGKGESQPVASNKTAKGKAQNRRVEFVVIK